MASSSFSSISYGSSHGKYTSRPGMEKFDDLDRNLTRLSCGGCERVHITYWEIEFGSHKSTNASSQLLYGGRHLNEDRSERMVVEMTISVDASMPLAGSHPVDQDSDTSYVWYASYASNLCTARFMCYIQGGKAEGMARACLGARDKTPPVSSRWIQVPHQLLFGRNWTKTWGSGGVAFLDPILHESCTTLIRIHKITVQQFLDVLAQENRMDPNSSKFDFEWSHIDALRTDSSASTHRTLEFLPSSWYGTVKCLGDEDGLPILTITCSTADMKKYKEGQLPVSAPSETYRQVIIKGLLEYGLSEEEARAYVLSRSPSDGP